MAVSLIIAVTVCAVMIASILWFPQIKIGKWTADTYWIVVLIGAVTCLVTRQVSLPSLWQRMTADSSINPIKILVLFLSMTLLSIFLDEVGFFRYLANKALSLAAHNQMRLFAVLYVTVSILTVFTSNDIIVLTFTPFICYFAKNAQISPRPYLVAEFVAANTMSMMLIIGNPTNIYIATSYQVKFLEYVSVMALPTLASGAVAFAVLWLLFRKELKEPAHAAAEEVQIQNKPFLIIGLADLAACTVILAIGSYIGIEMWLVALVAALLLFLLIAITAAVTHRRPTELKVTLRRAPWQLIPFVLSMFVLILSLSSHGVTEQINTLLGSDQTVFRYGLTSFLAANLINNIPMSVLFCSVIEPLAASSSPSLMQAVYATIIGSNLGAYLTPIGALAGIMWIAMLKKHNVRFGYIDFIKYGAGVALPTLATSLLILQWIL